MVRNHPMMGFARAIGVRTGGIRACLDQGAHQVGRIVIVGTLQQGRNPLDPHAGIDALRFQLAACSILELLKLHENQVPDLDKPVAILFRGTRRSAPDVIAMVIENLGTRPARARRPHLPEIVMGRDANDPAVLQPGDLLPDLRRLIVGVINRDQQLVLVDPQIARDQLPRKWDRVRLEIIAKREIPQHFKEGMMPRGVAHIVQIVMLAARAHTFLRRRCALVVTGFHPGEQVLELNHAGIGKHQRRVIAGHQRAAVHHLVTVLGKIVQKCGSDIVQRGHVCRALMKSHAGLSPCPGTVHRNKWPLP